MYEYNTELVNNNITEFKQRCKGLYNKPSIYFDMDNTLYVFSIYGKEPQALKDNYNEGYYKNLPIYPEAPHVLKALVDMGFDIGIQSSYIESPYCESEKRESLNYYFPMIPKENIILAPVGTDKIALIPNIKYSIVIDDYHKNLERVYELGGIGVKKSYSQKKRNIPTIHSLIEIFPLLQRLGCIK